LAAPAGAARRRAARSKEENTERRRIREVYRRIGRSLYPACVDVEITPEPTEEERAAILRALELEASEHPERSPWWEAGLEPPDEDGYATTPSRRQSCGATRA
jgi:hypothetical protein